MAVSPLLQIKLSGAKEIVKALDGLHADLRRTAEKAVLRAGARPILKRARELVPVRKGSGLLKKSLGSSVKMGKDGIRTARVGPRTGYGIKKTVVAKKTNSKKGRTAGQSYERSIDPVFYAHLVEYGTSRAPAQSFIRDAIEGAKGQVLDAMAKGLESYLEKYAARMARKAEMK